jgi:hypothetical protein
MDPRRYLLPDSLRFSRHFLAGRSAHLGEPERAYLALGEVLVDLDDAGCSMGSYSVRTGAELLRLREERAAARPRADAEYTRSVGDEPFDLPLGHMAGNGTPFLNLHPLNWEHALKKVETSCRALGADALIECFVGRGQFVDWTPAGRLSAPLFMPGGRALALGGRETPANASPSGWQFIGLAVRWADPGESSAGARETSDSLPADRQAGEHPGQPERGRPR